MIIYTPVKYYQIGMLRLGTEPVAMTLAFAIFIFLVIKGLEKQKLKMDVKEYFVFFSIVLFSALAGGRIWFYIAHWEGLKTIIDIFNLSKGGLYSIGCIIGGAIGLVVYALVRFKKEKKVWQIEFARIADINILVEIRVMDILSVTNRPAIVTAFLDDVYLIRRDIIAEVVPAHFRGPHPPIHIAPSKENGVPEPPRILPKITAVFVHRKNLCPLVIRLITNIAG